MDTSTRCHETGVTLEIGVDCGTIAVRYAWFWCRCGLWRGFRVFSFVFRGLSSQLKTRARFWPKTNKKLDHKTHRRAAQRHQKRDPPDTQTNAPHSARRSGVLAVYPLLFFTFYRSQRPSGAKTYRPPLLKQPRTPLPPPVCSTASVLGLRARQVPVPTRTRPSLSSTAS